MTAPIHETQPVFQLGAAPEEADRVVILLHGRGSSAEAMGAQVDLRIYPGMGHTVNQDEIDTVRRLLANGRP